MERKEYNFKCGINAYQQLLKVGEAKKLYALIKKLFPQSDDVKQVQLTDLLDKVIEGGVLNELFNILLKVEDCTSPDWDQLELNEALEVITDFFSLNKNLMSLLQTGNTAQAGSSEKITAQKG